MNKVKDVILYSLKVRVIKQFLGLESFDVVELVSLQSKHEDEGLDFTDQLVGDIDLVQVGLRLLVLDSSFRLGCEVLLQLTGLLVELLDHLDLVVNSQLVLLGFEELFVDLKELHSEDLTHNTDRVLLLVEVSLEKLEALELHFGEVRLDSAGIQFWGQQLTSEFLMPLAD